MYRVSIELPEWKFGRTRNAVGTRAGGECFLQLSRVLPNLTFPRVIVDESEGQINFHLIEIERE